MHDVPLDGLAHLLRLPKFMVSSACRCAAILNHNAVAFIEVFRLMSVMVFCSTMLYPHAHGPIGIMQFAGFSGRLTGKLCR